MTTSSATPGTASNRLSPAARGIIAVAFLLGCWGTFEAFYEANRMSTGSQEVSWLHGLLASHAVAVTDTPCERQSPPGSNPLFQPLGHCEFQDATYLSSPAFALLTRHSIVGPNVRVRLLINAVHVFGAISAFFLVLILALTRGSAGQAPINKLSKSVLLSTIFTLFVTGLLLFVLQDPGDMNYPRSIRADIPLVSWTFIPVIGLPFLSAVMHASLFRPISPRLVAVVHVLSLASLTLMYPVLVYRLATIDVHDYLWSYTLEMAILFSIYPVFDLTNGWVLYQSQVKGRSYDWDLHRDDNLIILTVLMATIIVFFTASQKHYFVSTQLPVAHRVALDLVPTMVWLASGRLVGYFKRSFGLGAARAG